MSVYVTLRISVDPAAFEKVAAAELDAMHRIMELAQTGGLIAIRWLRGENEVMAVEEWPDVETFQAFFDAAGPEIGPLMAAAGVTAPPEVTIWGHVAIDDVFGWGA
jgi:hypothetical protein